MSTVYKVGTIIHYMKDNKPHSAKVFSVQEITTSNIPATSEDHRGFLEPFGKAGVKYATCHGVFDQEEVAISQEDLFEILRVN